MKEQTNHSNSDDELQLEFSDNEKDSISVAEENQETHSVAAHINRLNQEINKLQNDLTE